MNLIIASGGLLSIDPGLFVWVLVTFGLFTFLFYKFAWGPILDALNQRENNIKVSIQAADEALKKAEKISADNVKALREAESMALAIRNEAIEEAEKLRQSRIEKAKAEVEKLLEDARLTIENEKKAALNELRNEVAKLALMATERILDAEIDKVKNKKLVDNFINELSKN